MDKVYSTKADSVIYGIANNGITCKYSVFDVTPISLHLLYIY